MYLAPLNYNRFFKKIFSDERIARKFLEDFLGVEITEFEVLKEKHLVTDAAAAVEFDFRCKIQDSYIIIDMQQWYKTDIVRRFFLYHNLNSALQLEALPLKRIEIAEGAKKYRKGKDYRKLEPVYTLIWMVVDDLKFDMDYVSYLMAPECLVNFIKNDYLWREPVIHKIMAEREKVLKVLENDAKDLDFLPKNRLIFMFQKNIVKNKKLEEYERWFEFAEKTRNENNEKKDFKEYIGDEIFCEMMRRLAKTTLTEDDFNYIEKEKTRWAEVDRLERGFFEDGKKEGKKEGIKEGIKEGEKKGKKEGKIETAKELLKMGIEIEKIAKATGLKKEEIQKL